MREVYFYFYFYVFIYLFHITFVDNMPGAGHVCVCLVGEANDGHVPQSG